MDAVINYNSLLGILMKSQIQSHVWHLNSESYEEHKTLGNYYESITDIIDNLGEIVRSYDKSVIFGDFKILIQPDPEISLVSYFEALRDSVSLFCFECENEDVKDVLIECIRLISSTIYKLNLK